MGVEEGKNVMISVNNIMTFEENVTEDKSSIRRTHDDVVVINIHELNSLACSRLT